MSTDRLIDKIKKHPIKSIICLLSFLIVLSLAIALIVNLSSHKRSKSSENTEKNHQNDDTYFKKSILRRILNSKLSLETKANVFSVTEQNGEFKKTLLNEIEDFHDLESLNGRLNLKEYENEEKINEHNLLLIDNLSEMYKIDYNLKIGESLSKSKTFYFYLTKWFPLGILSAVSEEFYNFLSPNYMLFYLLYGHFNPSENTYSKCKEIENTGNKNNLFKCEFIKDDTIKMDFFSTLLIKKQCILKRLTFLSGKDQKIIGIITEK